MNNSFLRQVATYFATRPGLENQCFVLPNHRSCKFLEREFDQVKDGPYITPQVMTIADFMTMSAERVVVPTVDALFILYECYTSIPGNEDYPFDKFVYWGNVVLSDFNDVDMYMVNPKELFANVREVREIVSNYIDDDLRELVRHYFGLSMEGGTAQDDEFWINNYNLVEGDDPGQVKAEYMRLWQSLSQLYEAYNARLDAEGYCSLGRIYRLAADAVKDHDPIATTGKFVFVGFNTLSTCEMAIFKRLSNRGKALFFWDNAAKAFNEEYKQNKGGRYINFLAREFPMPHDFYLEPIGDFPEIEVVGLPSNVGQAKYAFTIVDKLIADEHIKNVNNAINTAVVMPDESLFVPLLNSVSSAIGANINVTMGYPLHNSDIASLMRVVVKMHRQARRVGDDKWVYYRDDVKTVLSHPIIKTIAGIDALRITGEIDRGNLFAVPPELMEGTLMAPLFMTPASENDVEQVLAFLQSLTDFAESVLAHYRPSTAAAEAQGDDGGKNDNDGKNDDDGKNDKPKTIQEAFVGQYIDLLNRLTAAIKKYNLPPCEATLFMLIDRLASVCSVPLEGELLHGLQLMGMLETRCLDFENLIIVSANEQALPPRERGSSFISDYMRAYYNMPTAMHRETSWSYHFYRLIGRAQRLYMLYDTSDKSMGSGEVTRFVNQLRYVYKCKKIKETRLGVDLPPSSGLEIKVSKGGEGYDRLSRFRYDYGFELKKKRLSATSINEYINCGLMFYFDYIEELKVDNGDEDFMNAGTFGSIVHDTLQQLYYPDEGDEPRTGEYKVTCAMIKEFKKNRLDKVLTRKINELYLRSKDLDAALTGEASIVSVALKDYVLQAINYDIELLNDIDANFFTVLECERKHTITLTYGGVAFNFSYTADRIDRLNDGTMRMVDYKTGSDETKFNDIADLFVTTREKRCKAILQLMLYCKAYAVEHDYDGPIMPVIYSLKDMKKAGVIHGKEQLKDYREINDDFEERMGMIIKQLFDKREPFTQTAVIIPKVTPCRYCKFVDFCRR